MSFSPAAIPWIRTATPSTFTTEPRIARLAWLGEAFVLYSPGSMRMEVATVGEIRIDEYSALGSRFYLWVSSRSSQPCVHDPEANIPGLLFVRPGIRVFLGVDALHSAGSCRSCICAAEYD